MQHFTEQVIAIISRIPRGRVTTYGLIAAAAGNHCGARQVSRILHSSSDKYSLPWHRVVNIKGEISPRRSMSHITQKELLEQEAVILAAGRIDLEKFLWIP
ncbi:MAG: MGMT family protein [Desulfocapsaceae bacterium]|jgi:methylated-DNA-protein-cysteine methyltransferase-like protein|nr:MGMT family protein [Desulfocapsaceae bacterium]